MWFPTTSSNQGWDETTVYSRHTVRMITLLRRLDNREQSEGKKRGAGESGEAPPITFLFRAPFYFAQLPTI